MKIYQEKTWTVSYLLEALQLLNYLISKLKKKKNKLLVLYLKFLIINKENLKKKKNKIFGTWDIEILKVNMKKWIQ